MLWTRSSWSQKISNFDWRHFAARRQIRPVLDVSASIPGRSKAATGRHFRYDRSLADVPTSLASGSLLSANIGARKRPEGLSDAQRANGLIGILAAIAVLPASVI
jgi:hypothetical protein